MANSSGEKHVIVIGAGVVGVSTAIWLQRFGHQVTLVDKQGPAAGASSGNAGVLAANAVLPLAEPGSLRKIPSMLLDKNQPLFLQWKYLPALMPFFAKFVANATSKKVENATAALFDMLHDSASQHEALSKGTPAEKYLKIGDYVFGYKDKSEFEKDGATWQKRRELNFCDEEMTRDEFARYDPILGDQFGYGVRSLHHGHITDPSAYVCGLAEHLESQGGTVKTAEVIDITLKDNSATQIVTNTEILTADEVVIATGAWSGPLAKKLGIKVPLVGERGYHIEYINPSFAPKAPIMVCAGKFVITPMEGRLRCAGIAEFGAFNEERSAGPLELLKRQSRELMPGLKYDEIKEWMGFRPTTADSLPLIGRTTKATNVWTAFGHQHVGLTAGPKTGRWIASLISNQKPNIDLSPFDPARFE